MLRARFLQQVYHEQGPCQVDVLTLRLPVPLYTLTALYFYILSQHMPVGADMSYTCNCVDGERQCGLI